jgi:hypothetical protein
MQRPVPQNINVLWTGGWDSTYRVIQLVRLGKSVNPHYLVDPYRDSTKFEIDTINKISDILNKRYGGLIKKVKIFDSKKLDIDQGMQRYYEEILEIGYLGSQYLQLATYCKKFEIKDLDLCIHKDDKAYDYVHEFIEETEDGICYLSENAPERISAIFKYFRFPVLDMTKLEMEDDAKIWHDEDIMEMTWFCHQPFFGKSCGSCNPCMYTIDEGLSRRFSKVALIRYKLKLRLLKLPTILKIAHFIKYRLL